jgi:tRNA threonylcarbamoyladenosine biosynthesis protein TsaE
MTIELQARSAMETKELAGVIAEHARRGDLVVLAGDLGAGKTTFVQGFAAALGIDEPVTSPTFTLARTYPARLPLHHVDVYRLDRMSELADLALGELIDSDGVTLIEWGDVIVTALPTDFLEVHIDFGDDAEERMIAVRAVGLAWQARHGALVANLERWRR